MFSEDFRPQTFPPNDVSCSRSGSQVDPPPTPPPGVRGIVSPVSGCESVLSRSPRGSISMSAIFHNTLKKMTSYKLYLDLPHNPTT